MLIRLSLATAVLLLAVAGMFAQTAKVSGRVEDENKAAIPGASVIVKEGELVVATVTTDADGRFTVPANAGTVTIVVPGFTKVVHPVAAGEADFVVTLAPEPVKEQVAVTASRTQVSTDDSTTSVTVLDRDDIDRKGVNTVGDIFRTMAGTSTTNEGAFQVRPRIRGLESNRVLVLVDGERLNNGRTSTGQSGIEIGLIEPSQIDSVEVVRGSGSVLYGTDALSGTINIITRDTPARSESFRWGADFDTFFSSNEKGRRGTIGLTGSDKRFAFRISQSLSRYGNYFVGKANGAVPADMRALGGIPNDGEVLNSQSHSGTTHGVGRFFINDTNTLRLSFDRQRVANIGSPTLVGVFNGYFPFSNLDKVGGRYDSVNLTKSLIKLSISAYHQRQNRNFTNVLTVPPFLPFFPGQYQFSETITDTRSSGYDVQTDWRLGSRNVLVAGTSFFIDDNTDHRKIITASTPTSPNQTVRNSKSVPDASLSDVAFFAQDEFQLTKKLKLTGGVRFDRFGTNAKQTPEFALDPRFTQGQIEDLGLAGLTDGLNVKNSTVTGDVGFIYAITDSIKASARLGRSFRTPNIFERFFTDFGSVSGFLVGNPNLVPETGVNFDTGINVRKSKFVGSVTYFNNTYKNFLSTVQAFDRNGQPIQILRPPSAPIPVYQTRNVDEARIQGVEAEVNVPIKIRMGYLTPYGNFSFLRGDNLTAHVPLDTISPLRVNAGFRWENFLRSYFVNYDTRIVTRQDRLSPLALQSVNQGGNGGPEPGFVTHNVSGGYHFRRERYVFGVNLGISNIFNRAFSEQFVYAPARGRSFTIGTTFSIK